MNPPKCRTCGKAEWSHTCAPQKAKRLRRRYAREYYDKVRRKRLGYKKRQRAPEGG